MGSAISFVTTNWQEILLAVTSIVTGASIIVKFTPNTTDDKIVGKILNILSLAKKR